jgi:hypothetical protein
MNIEIIFAEFGNVKVDVDHFRKYFPNARFTLISDRKRENHGFDSHYYIAHPTFSQDSARYGWHMNDYWQVQSMFRSDADICLAFDADVRIVSEEILTIIPLVQKFGLCLPANSRMLVRNDANMGIDGGDVNDESHGNGFSVNCALTALDKKNHAAMFCAWTFCEIMKENPVRGPLAWWRAIWQTGFNPYLLPVQWCVCHNDIGCGEEIMLHIGHSSVKNFYKI